jgi:hypothetical protein
MQCNGDNTETVTTRVLCNLNQNMTRIFNDLLYRTRTHHMANVFGV